MTQGDDMQDALEMIEDAKKAWIDIAIHDNREIPEPETEEKYSGKFLVRVPKSLHKELAMRAKKEAVSLNQLATYFLSTGITRKTKIG